MPIYEINLTGVQPRVMIPNGTYDCVIQSYTEQTVQGHPPQFFYKFVIEHGPSAKKWFTDNVSLSPKALWKLTTLLACVGHPEEQLNGTIQFDPQSLVGQPITVTVENQPGKRGPNVVAYMMHKDIVDYLASQKPTNGSGNHTPTRTQPPTPQQTIQPQTAVTQIVNRFTQPQTQAPPAPAPAATTPPSPAPTPPAPAMQPPVRRRPGF